MVIDEAAQAVELSTLIPLRYGCKQCVLVGDPKQLPATIMSRAAVEYGYSRSLFARLMDCGHPVVQLKLQVRSWHGLGGAAFVPLPHVTCGCLCVCQYRAHPALSAFPSRRFYDGQLLDSEEVKHNREQPFHLLSIFRPLVVYDVHGSNELRSSSWCNEAEATLAINLLHALAHWECPAKDGTAIKVLPSR